MPVQFFLHLEGTAIDWYQENEEYFKRANWIEVETGFVERFKAQRRCIRHGNAAHQTGG